MRDGTDATDLTGLTVATDEQVQELAGTARTFACSCCAGRPDGTTLRGLT